MGGYGTWDALARQPKRFAAAVPICGGGDPKTAKLFAHVPIWVFHGEKDTVVKPIRSRMMVEALKAAGSSKVKYTEYPNVGHNSWTPAFREPDLLPWLFSQKRGS
jgi:predicted peptidase